MRAQGPRWLPTVVTAIAVAAAVSGCGGPPFIDLPNPLPGEVTEVAIDTFVVTTADGSRYEFINANPDDPGMGQAHLRVHVADRTPVLVSWRRDGYRLVAERIDDASGTGRSTPPPAQPQPFPSFPVLPSQ